MAAQADELARETGNRLHRQGRAPDAAVGDVVAVGGGRRHRRTKQKRTKRRKTKKSMKSMKTKKSKKSKKYRRTKRN